MRPACAVASAVLDEVSAVIHPGVTAEQVDELAAQRMAHYGVLSAVWEFGGRGVGRTMHEEPQVPNFVDGKRTERLVPGMTIAIEPMVSAGLPDVKVLNDGWTVVTQDGSLSAHFEHTVLITEGEPEILTCCEQMPSRLKVS